MGTHASYVIGHPENNVINDIFNFWVSSDLNSLLHNGTIVYDKQQIYNLFWEHYNNIFKKTGNLS